MSDTQKKQSASLENFMKQTFQKKNPDASSVAKKNTRESLKELKEKKEKEKKEELMKAKKDSMFKASKHGHGYIVKGKYRQFSALYPIIVVAGLILLAVVLKMIY